LPGWAPPEVGKAERTGVNSVRLIGRQLSWNGMDIDEETLRSYLLESHRLGLAAKKRNPEIDLPFLIFSPETNDCELARQIQTLIEQNYPCSSGICGQGRPESFVQFVN
jgi:hypothetical protein